jgi:thiol-disulfide isomerase/thioredoxin
MNPSHSVSRGRRHGLLLFILLVGPSTFATAGEDPKASFEFTRVRTAEGKDLDLKPTEKGVTVLVFYSSSCPISNSYAPTLNRIAKEFPSSLKLVGACVDSDLSDAEVVTHARDFELKFPVICDTRGQLAARLGAKVTPEAFLIDPKGRVRYHGRIDDQFSPRNQRNTRRDVRELRDAIAAVLEGKEVVRSYVPAAGCPIPKLVDAKSAGSK